MTAYLDERYFDWLYFQVCSVKQKSSFSHRNLLNILYTKEYVWLIPNDDNRAEDGKELRHEFLDEEGISIQKRDIHWLNLGCSFLEFLVALSRRLEFEAGGTVRSWFWELMTNLELEGLNDRVKIDREEVEDVLDRVNWRTYEYNGGGGLFPLRYPEQDQRNVEVWYQLCAYVLERGDI